jgi:hypothetical protein
VTSDGDTAEVPLVGSTWVHAFEEDGPEGAVYRPAGGALPLSRRPRRRLSFHADGTATVSDGGADDRSVGRAATWSVIDGTTVIHLPGGTSLRVVARAPGKLVVRSEPAPP